MIGLEGARIVAAEWPRKGQVMFAKLKAWAAALWQSMWFAAILEGRLRGEVRNRDLMIDAGTDRIRELLKQVKGLESDAAILVARQKEDAAKIEELAASVQFYGDRAKAADNLVKMLEESHVKANKEILQLREQKEYDAKTHELLADERDKHMRSAAEWQGRCKRMTLELEASRAIIAGTKLAEGEMLIVQGNMDGLIKLRQYMAGISLTKCVFVSDKMAAWKATPISTPGNTSATEPVNAGSVWPDTSEFTDPASPLKSTTKTARYLEPALEELPAPEPEIATTEKLSSIQEASEVIQSLLIEMHPGMTPAWWQKCMTESSPVGRALKWLQSHVNSGNINKVRGTIAEVMKDSNTVGVEPVKVPVRIPPADQLNGTLG